MMFHFGFLPTVVSPPGLLLTFTGFLEVTIGKILSHISKTSYNNLPNLVLHLNLHPINFNFSSIGSTEHITSKCKILSKGYLVVLALP